MRILSPSDLFKRPVQSVNFRLLRRIYGAETRQLVFDGYELYHEYKNVDAVRNDGNLWSIVSNNFDDKESRAQPANTVPREFSLISGLALEEAAEKLRVECDALRSKYHKTFYNPNSSRYREKNDTPVRIVGLFRRAAGMKQTPPRIDAAPLRDVEHALRQNSPSLGL